MKRSLRNGIGTVTAGAILLIAAVSGFIIVPEHKPHKVTTYRRVRELDYPRLTPGAVSCDSAKRICEVKVRTYLAPSHTLYDALRITTWALLIIGLLLVAIGLARYARLEPETPR